MDGAGSARTGLAGFLRVAALLALLSLGPAVAGCGGDDRDAVRERVKRYIESEQEVMRRAQPEFERANQAYVAYAKGELEPHGGTERVAQAERGIRIARDGVLVLDAPPEARPLHEDLVRYLDMNVELARETSRLVRYVPAAARALAPLDRVNGRLQSRLARAGDSDAQARILAGYSETLASIGADLRALKAPAVLQGAHSEQARRLDATRRLAGRLSRALRAQDAELVSVLLKRFRTTTPEPGAQRRLANQAVARYNERLKRLAVAYAAVRREQIRLARSLGG
jgi:hypothetical protein